MREAVQLLCNCFTFSTTFLLNQHTARKKRLKDSKPVDAVLKRFHFPYFLHLAVSLGLNVDDSHSLWKIIAMPHNNTTNAHNVVVLFFRQPMYDHSIYFPTWEYLSNSWVLLCSWCTLHSTYLPGPPAICRSSIMWLCADPSFVSKNADGNFFCFHIKPNFMFPRLLFYQPPL